MTRMAGAKARRRGFTLAELMVFVAAATVMLAAVASVESASRRATLSEMVMLRTMEDSRRLSGYMRADVARAESVKVSDEGRELSLTVGGGEVRYRVDESGRLVREVGGRKKEAIVLGKVDDFHAEVDASFPKLVRLRVLASRSSGVREFRSERVITAAMRGSGVKE